MLDEYQKLIKQKEELNRINKENNILSDSLIGKEEIVEFAKLNIFISLSFVFINLFFLGIFYYVTANDYPVNQFLKDMTINILYIIAFFSSYIYLKMSGYEFNLSKIFTKEKLFIISSLGIIGSLLLFYSEQFQMIVTFSIFISGFALSIFNNLIILFFVFAIIKRQFEGKNNLKTTFRLFVDRKYINNYINMNEKINSKIEEIKKRISDIEDEITNDEKLILQVLDNEGMPNYKKLIAQYKRNKMKITDKELRELLQQQQQECHIIND